MEPVCRRAKLNIANKSTIYSLVDLMRISKYIQGEVAQLYDISG
jgi:hypothetical protein